MTMDDTNGQSGYYQEIARAFLGRRGGSFFLSPKDQATIAAWEEQRIPLRVVLEGIGRAFDTLKARGRGTKAISLVFCGREVEAVFAQHRRLLLDTLVVKSDYLVPAHDVRLAEQVERPAEPEQVIGNFDHIVAF